MENYDLKKSYFDASINKNYFYAGEDIRFMVSAFDANKLPLLDANVKVVVSLTQLVDFSIDSLFVPFAWSKKFWEYNSLADPSGVSMINFPQDILPKAMMQFNARITITNPEGEYREFNLYFMYDNALERYQITQDKDSIKTEYLYNSGIVGRKATLKAFNLMVPVPMILSGLALSTPWELI